MDKILKDPSLMMDRPLPDLPEKERKRPPTWNPPTPPEKNLPELPKRAPPARVPHKRDGVHPPKRTAPIPPRELPVQTIPNRLVSGKQPPPPPPPLMVNEPPPIQSREAALPKVPPPVVQKNPHNDLLSQIHLGVTLKKTSDQPKVLEKIPADSSDDVNSDLFSALLGRVKHMATSDTEDSDDTWDDD
jgi:hypothetical protein